MKKLLFLALVFSIFSCNNESVVEEQALPPCDNGTFVGDAMLKTQQEVDDFGAMCYSAIDGYLVIGEEGIEDNVMDLSSLNSIRSVSKWLTIFASNLTSLEGLHKIETVGGFSMRYCHGLSDLSGLDGLTGIVGQDGVNYGFRVLYNLNLESLSGLDNLKSINGFMQIYLNESLTNLNGLQNLEKIAGEGGLSYGVELGSNPELLNFDALESLVEVKGYFSTLGPCLYPGSVLGGSCGNEKLTDLCGLQNLLANGTYEDVYIIDNAYNPTVQDIIDGNCAQ